jgi:glyoxylase-like metal-dependent hydrolase (beta-lactamase superfamily II)/rhodanese-related sulfurtransferase
MALIIEIPDPGLGNTSYLVDLGDGTGLVIDPERDPRPYLEAARIGRLKIRYVAETHLHADFVSGARELVAEGASLIAPRESQLAYPHQPVGEGDELKLGDMTMQVFDTPGHTPEHVAYLLSDGARPQALFSGGTLLAGGVARPDLISPELTVTLARQAYQSVRRILSTLPDEVEVRPTHGGGSFCASAEAPRRAKTTVGFEKRTHPAIVALDSDQFVNDLLSGLGTFPPYFLRLREVNRQGAKVLGGDLAPLPRIGVDNLEGKTIVDARPIDIFAQGHIPGSISIALSDQFGTWLGWLFGPDTKLVFVLDPEQDERELMRQALNVGCEDMGGRVDFDEWLAAGGKTTSIDLIPAVLIGPDAPILDVRQSSEWEKGHVQAAIHIELGALSHGSQVAPGTVIHCGHGPRAMTAASLLARAGNSMTAVTTAEHFQIASAIRTR